MNTTRNIHNILSIFALHIFSTLSPHAHVKWIVIWTRSNVKQICFGVLLVCVHVCLCTERHPANFSLYIYEFLSVPMFTSKTTIVVVVVGDNNDDMFGDHCPGKCGWVCRRPSQALRWLAPIMQIGHALARALACLQHRGGGAGRSVRRRRGGVVLTWGLAPSSATREQRVRARCTPAQLTHSARRAKPQSRGRWACARARALQTHKHSCREFALHCAVKIVRKIAVNTLCNTFRTRKLSYRRMYVHTVHRAGFRACCCHRRGVASNQYC